MSDTNLIDMLVQKWAKHQKTRPFDPDNVGSPPEYAVQMMDQWQREDSSYRLILGTWLANDALHAAMKAEDTK